MGSNAWYLPDSPMTFQPTKWKVYNHGKATATAIGGNLSTFSLLRGTRSKTRRVCLFW